MLSVSDHVDIDPPDLATAPASADGAQFDEMDRSLIRGVAWLGMMKWTGQIVAWASTFVVARLLTPTDYGIVGAASLYLGLLTIVSEFGIGSAVVVLRTLSTAQLKQINTISIAFGLIGFLLSALLSHWIAVFFHSPAVGPVVVALSSTFLIGSFRTVAWALLQRDMRFRRIAVFEGFQALALAGLSVILALAGFRYWTLVIASIVSVTITSGLALALHWVGFAVPKWHDVRRAVVFSKDIILQRIAWFTYSDSDFLVAGRVLGEQALGGYTMAWTLANAPIDKIGNVILQVTPSALSAVRDDRPATARYVASVTEVVATLTFPLFIGLALVAPDFVTVVLGIKWISIVTPLRLLSLYACFRVVLPVLAQVLTVRGEEKFAARNMMLGAVVLPITFLIASRWGLTGIALGWICVHPLIAYRLCDKALDSIGMSFKEFFTKPLWPALSGCGVMAIAVSTVRLSMSTATPGWERLITATIVGAAAYVVAILFLHRERVRVLSSMIRMLKSVDT